MQPIEFDLDFVKKKKNTEDKECTVICWWGAVFWCWDIGWSSAPLLLYALNNNYNNTIVKITKSNDSIMFSQNT